MRPDSNTDNIRLFDRTSLRLAPDTFRAIDAVCAQRPGQVSRNTWLTEAVEEKLARESARSTAATDRRRHG